MLAKASTAEQGTEQWKIDRIGYVTASAVPDVMAKGSGATRRNYMAKLLCEILTGKPTKGYKSKYMQDGNDREDIVRAIYTQITGRAVTKMPFYYIEEEKIGASVDGDVDADGLMEMKNVIPAEQLDLLTTGKIKSGYIKQMQTQMYVREKKWCDYVSASLGDDELGELPDKYKIKIIRVERDEDMILQIRKEVAFFHHDLKQLIKKIEGE